MITTETLKLKAKNNDLKEKLESYKDKLWEADVNLEKEKKDYLIAKKIMFFANLLILITMILSIVVILQHF